LAESETEPLKKLAALAEKYGGWDALMAPDFSQLASFYDELEQLGILRQSFEELRREWQERGKDVSK